MCPGPPRSSDYHRQNDSVMLTLQVLRLLASLESCSIHCRWDERYALLQDKAILSHLRELTITGDTDEGTAWRLLENLTLPNLTKLRVITKVETLLVIEGLLSFFRRSECKLVVLQIIVSLTLGPADLRRLLLAQPSIKQLILRPGYSK